MDGQWSDWTDWTACSKLCGTGERERTRTCTKPAPANGGKQCSGRDRQTQECNVQPCTGTLQLKNKIFLKMFLRDSYLFLFYSVSRVKKYRRKNNLILAHCSDLWGEIHEKFFVCLTSIVTCGWRMSLFFR